MNIVLEIPENFRISFQRMKRILPTPVRQDPVVQKTTLAYLKLGGERLARHYIKLVKYRLKELDELRKMAQEEALAKEIALAKEKAIAEKKEAAEIEAAKEREAVEGSEIPVNELQDVESIDEGGMETSVDNTVTESENAESDEDTLTVYLDTSMDTIPFTELGGGVYPFEETAAEDISTVSDETPITETGNVEPLDEMAVEDIATVSDETPITETGGVEPFDETTAEDIATVSDETPITETGGVEPIEETVAEDIATVSEETDTIEEVVEPFLLKCGMLRRTPRGRVVTDRAYQALGIPMPEEMQQN